MIESITIHNEGYQQVRLSSNDPPSGNNYNTMGPDDIASFEINPEGFYAQRSSSNSNPKVVVTFAYYTPEYIKEMADKIHRELGSDVNIILCRGV